MTVPRGKKASKEKREAPTLDCDEWSFKSLPDAETEACYVYEYGREFARQTPRILTLLANLKAAQASKKKGWVSLCWELDAIFEIAFPYFPTLLFAVFPDSPWQKVSAEYRSHIVEHVSDGYGRYIEKLPSRRLSIQTLRELEPARINSLRAFRFVHELCEKELSQTEYGFFAINWSHKDTEIRDAFEKWLSNQRAERVALGITNVKHKSRGGFRDRLNWLGALRVVNHYPREQLADYPDTNLEIDAPYSHLPDLYQSAKNARELLAALFKLGDRS